MSPTARGVAGGVARRVQTRLQRLARGLVAHLTAHLKAHVVAHAMASLVAGLLVWGAMSSAQAAKAPSASADPALEAQVLKISAELRCLVCQNQTIADSHADLAIDLRNQVRSMLQQGQGKDQIIQFMTERYGSFVLYRPPVNTSTWLLWFGPTALLVIAVGVFVWVLRRRARLAPDRFEPDPEEV